MKALLFLLLQFIQLGYCDDRDDFITKYKNAINIDDKLEYDILHSTTGSIIRNKWSCPIAYVLDPGLIEPTRVVNAMTYISKMTGWTFISRTTETDYLNFIDSTGCASYVGKQGGSQNVWLSEFCTFGATIHEIGHAIGLEHEHTRMDRDEYVLIDYSNIKTSSTKNFDIKNVINYGNYDYNSIMHYGRWDFAINASSQIITPIGDVSDVCYIGQRTELTPKDIIHLNKLIDGTQCNTNSLEEIINECNTSSITICGVNSQVDGFNLIFTEYELTGTYNGKNEYYSKWPYRGEYIRIYYYDCGLFCFDYWLISYDGNDYAYNYDSDIIGSSNWYQWKNEWIFDPEMIVSQKECCNVENSDWIGNGWCDSGEYNTELCYWDGGDCCQESCSDDDYTCGDNGYNCLDTGFSSSSAPTKSPTSEPTKSPTSEPTSEPTKSPTNNTTHLKPNFLLMVFLILFTYLFFN
jgi:hypothetical protein